MDKGIFCYKVMPFGLKNARATYQKMMNKVFKDRIRRNLEVYVYAMLIKSKTLGNYLADLEENYIMKKNNKVKITLAKFTFEVITSKFLRFMLTRE